MLVANHALAGAVIGASVQQPAIAIPLAFVSHFVMDALPHFGIPVIGDDVRARNRRPLMKVITVTDLNLTLILLITLPLSLQNLIGWPLLLACMLAAIAPDAVWVGRFIKERKTGVLSPMSWFSSFHKKIQWGESPKGLMVDVVWFGISIALIARFVW